MPRNDIQLPENYDPYDMRLKTKFHAKADKKNVIGLIRGKPTLCCGALIHGKTCRQRAGAGTEHQGYGRCKLHGGNNTGPKTEEGKAKVKYNGVKHGLFMKSLLPGEDKIFTALSDEDDVKSLTYEITLLKTKIIAYLMRQSDKFQADVAEYGEEIAYKNSRVWFAEGDGVRRYYHAGTIEDNALDRALRTLRSLVETHNRLKGVDDGQDIVDVINKELKAASHGSIALSWSAPKRVGKQTKNTDNCSTNCSKDAE